MNRREQVRTPYQDIIVGITAPAPRLSATTVPGCKPTAAGRSLGKNWGGDIKSGLARRSGEPQYEPAVSASVQVQPGVETSSYRRVA